MTQEQQPQYHEAIGRTIKTVRTAQGIERRDLADRAGISYPYLAQIENGARKPSADVLLAIATALGMRPHDLLRTADELGAPSFMDFPAPARTAPSVMPPPPDWKARWFHRDDAATDAEDAAQRMATAPPTRDDVLDELLTLVAAMDDADTARLLDLARRLSGRSG